MLWQEKGGNSPEIPFVCTGQIQALGGQKRDLGVWSTQRAEKGKEINIKIRDVMNIQSQERDVLKKKNLPSALGKSHLLKQPHRDNTELNISLSVLNTFMIQTAKQH